MKLAIRALALTLALSAATARAEASLFAEGIVGFVPYANDAPLMLGVGVHFARHHEIFARFGWMPTGDDVNYAFGAVGYRYVFLPGHLFRPFVGGLVAGLPATCGHDSAGRPDCSANALFIFSAMGGVRIEPVRWFSVGADLLVGADSYPNPFGMIELSATFFLPLGV